MRQVLDACRRITDDAEIQERVLRQTLRLAAEMPFDHSPPWMGQQIHRLLREATGNDDPYREAKCQANELALSLRPTLEQRVRGAADPFAAAAHLAIAANIIDLGCKSRIPDEAVLEAIDRALSEPFDAEAVDDFRRAVRSAKDILYLADNAGEIVLDRLLIEQMPMERITVAVRGSPVINDATREDAAAAGLTELVKVIDNGSDVPGTILESCSPAFRRVFEQAELVVAKGQGNYETLNQVNQRIYFLLKAKCPVIARDLGCEVGQAVLCRGGAGEATAESACPAVLDEGAKQ